ncbi:MAG: guanine permease [Gammaproteobacteria bacterium]|nr:guanine permease [Gammaproteobacteria bacterium]HBW84799.1 guanine permease [Gammaproteobacteria bacterium]|tara:strand:+ start:5572 stop:6870 length:1299 start_codon:yes stop_codon:yes gene_type:complete
MKQALINFFEIDMRQTSIPRECIAGLTTYITMAYIVVVNPEMMAQAGMDYDASFTATCVAAATASFAMGVVANWPVALAPGVGLSAFFTYTVVGELGYSWQVALGAVFLSSILFIAISLTPLRKLVLASIPRNLRFAIAAGIGLFIGFIGLKNSGIVVADSASYVSLGDLASAETFLGLLGFILITVLSIRRIPGAIILGIASITGLAIVLGKVDYYGLISQPPPLTPILLELDILGAMNVGMVTVVLAFLFVNLFDTAGTLFAVADSAKLNDESNNITNINAALKTDSISSMLGTIVGCAPVTSYVESSAGVSAGGRTGLTAVFTALFFCLTIFVSPLASMVPPYATAGALIYVAMIMLSGLQNLDWHDQTELIPALITVVMIPMSFSIADGIAIGFISFAVIKTFTGKSQEVSYVAWALSALFALKLIFI